MSASVAWRLWSCDKTDDDRHQWHTRPTRTRQRRRSTVVDNRSRRQLVRQRRSSRHFSIRRPGAAARRPADDHRRRYVGDWVHSGRDDYASRSLPGFQRYTTGNLRPTRKWLVLKLMLGRHETSSRPALFRVGLGLGYQTPRWEARFDAAGFDYGEYSSLSNSNSTWTSGRADWTSKLRCIRVYVLCVREFASSSFLLSYFKQLEAYQLLALSIGRQFTLRQKYYLFIYLLATSIHCISAFFMGLSA